MRKGRTVVSVQEHRVDENGNFLNKDGEIVDSTKKGKASDVEIVDVMYYLLHWGLTYEILTDRGNNYPVSYTVAICQHLSNGKIKTFIPAEVTVVGREQE